MTVIFCVKKILWYFGLSLVPRSIIYVVFFFRSQKKSFGTKVIAFYGNGKIAPWNNDVCLWDVMANWNAFSNQKVRFSLLSWLSQVSLYIFVFVRATSWKCELTWFLQYFTLFNIPRIHNSHIITLYEFTRVLQQGIKIAPYRHSALFY